MDSTRKLILIVGSILGVLILAAVIVGFVIVGQLRAAADQAEHSRIVQICEDTFGKIADGHLDEVVNCIERLKEP